MVRQSASPALTHLPPQIRAERPHPCAQQHTASAPLRWQTPAACLRDHRSAPAYVQTARDSYSFPRSTEAPILKSLPQKFSSVRSFRVRQRRLPPCFLCGSSAPEPLAPPLPRPPSSQHHPPL